MSLRHTVRHCFEVTWRDGEGSPAFATFAEAGRQAKRIQFVGSMERERNYPDGLEIRDAAGYLAELDLLAR